MNATMSHNIMFNFTLLFLFYLQQGSHHGQIKQKASWALCIDWLALTWDHHIPHSNGQHPASNLQHSKGRLLRGKN